MDRLAPEDHPPSWLSMTPVAHRGLHSDGVPENSLAAFDAAARAGYAMELDVHVSRDNRLVVTHDADTTRLTDVTRRVADATVAELQQLRLAGTSERIPTLEQVFEVVAGRTPVLIELKPGTPGRLIGPLVVAALDAYDGPVAVMSFDPRIVRWFAVNAPGIRRGQLGGAATGTGVNAMAMLLLRLMPLNGLARPHFIAYDVRAAADPTLALWRRTLAVPVLVWTVRTQADLQAARLIRANVIFEGPEATASLTRTEQ